MSGDVVIRADGLGKAYMISHAAGGNERYVALRDVLAGAARRAMGRIRDPARGASVSGDSSVEEFWALRDVNFEVKRGEVVGVIGRNGAGKSTLLKVLSRITEPTRGRVEIRGRLASLLEVGTGFHPELTGRENIFLNGAILGMTRAEIRRKFDEIVAFAEVEKFLDTPVKRYSSGMYVRLAFAVAAHLEPEILVVDEVLSVGDAEFQKKCLGKMQDVSGQGRTVLFVSHDMAAMRFLCPRCILLASGNIDAFGETHTVISEYNRARAAANSKSYPEGSLVRSIVARQSESRIVIELEYSALPSDVCFPGVGFIIHGWDGRPLFGHNSMLEERPQRSTTRNGGHARIVVNGPPLLDGSYLISIQMGDHHHTYFSDPQCLALEVSAMIDSRYQLEQRKVGSIYPSCSYEFTDSL